jgi:hypothetical protein
MLYCLVRHPILNVICIIYCFSQEGTFHVLGLNHTISLFFQCLVLYFSNTILMSVLGNKELMLNFMFSIKICESFIDILPPIIYA